VIGYWTPDPLRGCHIRLEYQVLMVNRKSMSTQWWEEGFDTLEKAKGVQQYLLSAEHWNDYIPYVLKLPEGLHG